MVHVGEPLKAILKQSLTQAELNGSISAAVAADLRAKLETVVLFHVKHTPLP